MKHRQARNRPTWNRPTWNRLTWNLHSFYKNKKVLVTGGAGFIGSHIAEKLCSYGAIVTILDDLSTGSLDNLQSFRDKITLIASDITIFKTVLKATKKQVVVFHTAAFVSVPDSVQHPVRCEKINVEGTKNLLEASKENKVKTFIFSSSASVYGQRSDTCAEDNRPNPQSPYAQSKLDGEKLCAEYGKKYGLHTASLRYFNVYGDRQNPFGPYAGVATKFKYNLLAKQPIVIYGDGQQTRDFIHVTQVAEANLILGTHQPSRGAAPLQGDIFNIASGTSITLLALLEALENETSTKRTDLQFKPARKGDIQLSSASCKKYKNLKEQYAPHD